jgi:hypothetical protein
VLDTGLVPPSGSKFEADLIQAVLDGLCPNVSSARSLPAQIAVAFGTEEFFTASTAGFADGNDGAQRRRQEAIAYLRKSSSPLAAAAALRRFKAGQKGSTFPWSNTATALFEQAGHCWLASHIAIIGAASPYKLGFTRRPATTPFGPNGHPATLLAETRANAADRQWWRDQLEHIDNEGEITAATTMDGDLARAEWVLVLWCVAPAAVIASMFTAWQSVFAELPAVRRHGVMDAALRVSAHGWLEPLTAPADPANNAIRILIEARGPQRPLPSSPSTFMRKPHHPAPPSLLTVARADNWLKVDTVGTYR